MQVANWFCVDCLRLLLGFALAPRPRSILDRAGSIGCSRVPHGAVIERIGRELRQESATDPAAKRPSHLDRHAPDVRNFQLELAADEEADRASNLEAAVGDVLQQRLVRAIAAEDHLAGQPNLAARRAPLGKGRATIQADEARRFGPGPASAVYRAVTRHW